jgi:hypothetical protein
MIKLVGHIPEVRKMPSKEYNFPEGNFLRRCQIWNRKKKDSIIEYKK